MNINELNSLTLADYTKFHDVLNPKLWTEQQELHPEVKAALTAIADDFRNFLGVNDFDLKDITVSGSNAGYNYNPNSDIDLHLVVDLPEADTSEVYRELFDAKKYQYNDVHNIKIHGSDVELYVQNANQPHVSQGIYSLLHDKWIIFPKKIKTQIDDISVISKFQDLEARIKSALASDDIKASENLLKKIKNMRVDGLARHGEFGVENLTFKLLRSEGLIDQLRAHKNKLHDQELSLVERGRKKHKVRRRYAYGGFWYPGYSFSSVEGSSGSEGSESIFESHDTEVSIREFAKEIIKELGITDLPKILIHKNKSWTEHTGSFGRYEPQANVLHLAIADRHILDILRTMAHELVHCAQRHRGQLPPDAGETGSPYEDEANALAGRIMRGFAERRPELFRGIQLESSGYIPTEAEKDDPRFLMALTGDVRPGETGRQANKLGLQTDSQGHPALLRPGKKTRLSESNHHVKATEDWHANDKPPGPEVKPTMPRGTVRVDVSDMYDWYKLGKNIANLDQADPTQFGKGPPSTIVSFGDEDTEHKYIKNLQNLGLTTTDIDPIDVNQPPGMPRQKTDPTFNVNEVSNPRYKFLRPGELTGSYTDQQLRDLGFKKSQNGKWFIAWDQWNQLTDPKNPKIKEDLDVVSDLPSIDLAKQNLNKILAAAQRIYDDWDESDVDTYAGGGICHLISDAICSEMWDIGIECTTVSCSYEQHVYVAVKVEEGVYTIDIPYGIYEEGGGFNWKKIPDIKFKPGNVVFYKVSGDPKEFDNYTALEEAAASPDESLKKNQSKLITDITQAVPAATEIWFYGSRARGTHRRGSDYDILVLVPDNIVGNDFLDIQLSLEKLSRGYANFDIQASHSWNQLTQVAKDEGQLLWPRSKQVSQAKNPDSQVSKNVIFLNDRSAIVGQVHGKKLKLSTQDQAKVKQLADQYGAWYEGNGMDREFTKGIIDDYQGSWDDDLLSPSIKGYPYPFLYVLFSNIKANDTVKGKIGSDPKVSIFDRILNSQPSTNYFPDRKFDAETLTKFLQSVSEGPYDFVKMSQAPATEKNVQRFFQLGEKLMWPENWEEYPNKAGQLAKQVNDLRDKFLASRKSGVYVVGSGHLVAVQQILGRQGVAEGLSWSALDEGLSIENKMAIFEEYAIRGNLTESIDQDKKDYFVSLFELSDSPIKNKKYIVAPLALIGNKIMQLDSPAVMRFLGKNHNVLVFDTDNGQKTYPSKTLRDLSVFNTFTFASHSSYDKFRTALSLKFDIELASIDKEQGVAEDQTPVNFGDSVDYDGLIMTMHEGDDGFKLEAANPQGRMLGFVEFWYDTDGTLHPEQLEVDERYRGQGIAKSMYDFVKGQGFKIARSAEQTDAGRAFWNKNRPGQRIWEQDHDDLVESLRREFELLEDEMLGEIKMSPSNLRAEAARTGALAGMEFEMIVPGVSGGDYDYPEMVQDYSHNPRTRSISDIVEFFNDGDYNSRREVNRLEQNLVTSYAEWVDEQFGDRWEADKTEMVYEFVRYELDPEITAEILGFDADNRPDGFSRAQLAQVADIIADDPQNAWHDEAKDYARDSFQENADQSDWLDEEGMEHMSDVVDRYDIQWPYWEQEETDSAGVDIDSVARDFGDAVGRPVNASRSYHGARREPGHYVVEPDGSLRPDDDDDMGLEFVSPPLPIDELLSDLNKVKKWADQRGCYTNRSTGLHINVSVPEFDIDKLDYVKLALLLGDEYVLDQFGRSSNTYARSALSIVRDRVRSNPETAKSLLDKMRGHMEDLATKALHSGDTSKYTSINTKTGYIEFRSPGGDWLDENFDKIEPTLLRFTVALKAALDPQAYRKEYLSKLRKLLEPTAEEGSGLAGRGTRDTVNYFADYVAGKIPRAALRSFVKQAQLQRGVKRGQASGLRYWWRVYKDGKDSPNTPMIEVVAVDKKEAIDLAGAEWGVFSQEYKSRMDAEPVRPYKEGQDQPATDSTTAMLNGRPSNPDGNTYIAAASDPDTPLYRYMAAGTADAQLVLDQWKAQYGDNFVWRPDHLQLRGQPRSAQAPDTATGVPPSQTDYENRLGWPDQTGDANYEVVDRSDYRPVFLMVANTVQDAARKYEQWLNMMGLPDDTEDYGFRERARPGSTLDIQRRRAGQLSPLELARQQTAQNMAQTGSTMGNRLWQIVDNATGEVAYEFYLSAENNQQDANEVGMRWVRNNGNPNTSYSVRAQTQQPGTVIPQNQEGNTQWRILVNGQEIHRFWNRPNQGEANAAASAWVGDQIRRGLLSRDQIGEIEIVPVMDGRT